MATYVNDLRLKEIATGDESGTWGTSTNTNLELVAEAFSFGTEAITTNADTHTTTIADGATDPGRSIFLKYTGTLDSTCTITIGPNTVSKLWLIENATSGSQSIVISQGSGASITIANGQTKAIYSDGAGSGAAMVDAFQDLSVPDLFVDDDLTVGDDLLLLSDSAVMKFGADSDTTLTHTDGTGLTLNSTNKLTFGDTASFIQQSSDGVLRIDGEATIDLNASTAVTVSNDLKLDSDSAEIGFGADNDTRLTHTDDVGLTLNGNNKLMFNDASQFIQGSSATVLSLGATDEIDLTATAIDVNGTMDVSGNATLGGTLGVTGAVTANAGVVIDNITIDGTEIDLSSGDLTVDVAGDIILDAGGDNILIKDAGTHYANITMASNSLLIDAVISDGDLIFRGNDGGATITALTLDMSAAGNAIFNGNIALADSKQLQMGADADFIIYHDGTSNYVQAAKQDSDIILRGNDGGSGVNMLTLDTSAAGAATFNAGANFGGNIGVGTSSPGNIIEVEGASPIVEINASSGSPELQFSDGGTDEFSIMYDTGANELKIVEGGVGTQVSIADGGDTGIGGSAVAGFRLDVMDTGATSARIRSTGDYEPKLFFFTNGTTATNSIYFGDTGNTAAGGIRYFHNGDNLTFSGKGSGSEMARFNSSGQLGINTSSPAYTLDVDSTIHIGNDGTSGFTHSRLIFDAAASARGAGNFFHNQGDDVEYFAGSPYNKTDSFAICRNATASHADATANVANSLVVVDGTGKMGIGLQSPTSRLHVNDDTDDGYVARFSQDHATGYGVLIDVDGTDNADPALRVDNAAGTIGLFVSQAGNVGINNTAPTQKLDVTGNIALHNGTAPTSSETNGVVLYAEDVSSSSELKVRDEAGNVTTLSPHNFDLIPEGPSEDMAWSYFSEKDGKRINVDMLKAIRVLEKMSGEKLVFES